MMIPNTTTKYAFAIQTKGLIEELKSKDPKLYQVLSRIINEIEILRRKP